MTPSTLNAASLTFAFTPYPGLIVHAGALHDFAFPMCGCDACDESVSSVADRLESTVQAVVPGGFREHVRDGDGELWISYQLTTAEGSRSGSGLVDTGARASAAFRDACTRLDRTPGGRVAWRGRQPDPEVD